MLPGIGPVSSSRAGAFVANADDASAIGSNPAGLAKQTGTVITIGSMFIDYSLKYQRAGTYDALVDEKPSPAPWRNTAYAPVEDDSSPAIGLGPFQAIPLIAISTDLGLGIKGLRFGAGVFAPNAYPSRSLNADYDINNVDEAPAPNRYDVLSEDAAVISPSIAVAYRVHKMVDIGLRVSWAFAHLESRNSVWAIGDNVEEAAELDAVFDIEGSDPFVSSYESWIPPFALGVLVRPTSFLEFGAHFTSRMDIRTKGKGTTQLRPTLMTSIGRILPTPADEFELKCADGGTEQELKACVELGLPMTATIGGRFVGRDADGNERFDVELDVAYERHSEVSDYTVLVDAKAELLPEPLFDTTIRHGFQDTVSVRLGGSYALPLNVDSGVILRGGVAYDTAAAKDEWERLDLDGAARATFALGAAYRARRFQVDVGGGFVYEGSREVGDGCNPTWGQEGCGDPDNNTSAPVEDRNAPDPAQPPVRPNEHNQSPFNQGTYESHYLMFMLGFSTWF